MRLSPFLLLTLTGCPQATPLNFEVAWTIEGLAPSRTNCEGDDLAVLIEIGGIEQNVAICTAGLQGFDDYASSLGEVSLSLRRLSTGQSGPIVSDDLALPWGGGVAHLAFDLVPPPRAEASQPPPPRFFVSSTTLSLPNPDGLDAADALCTGAAYRSSKLDARAKAQTWKAMLGWATRPGSTPLYQLALDRIGPGGAKFINVNGDALALDNFALGDVIDGRLVTEEGQPLPLDDDEVATGAGSTTQDLDREGQVAFMLFELKTAVNAGFSGAFCDGWTVDDGAAVASVGHTHTAAETPHPGWPAGLLPHHLRSFDRACDRSTHVTDPTGLSLKIPAPASGQWHLYCFTVEP